MLLGFKDSNRLVLTSSKKDCAGYKVELKDKSNTTVKIYYFEDIEEEASEFVVDYLMKYCPDNSIDPETLELDELFQITIYSLVYQLRFPVDTICRWYDILIPEISVYWRIE